MTETIVIGSQQLDRAAALAAAAEYLSSSPGRYAYPSYDAYDTGAPTDRLSDGDLLASVLLNARVSIAGFESLRAMRDEFEAALRALPAVTLIDATDDHLRAVAALYAPLDRGMPGVGGTILSKVLHRKRPELVPLYDSRLYSLYVPRNGRPIPRPKRGQKRTWVEFMYLYAAAIQKDLRMQPNAVALATTVAALATRQPISLLRAWDILAWQRAGLEPAEGDYVESEQEVP